MEACEPFLFEWKSHFIGVQNLFVLNENCPKMKISYIELGNIPSDNYPYHFSILFINILKVNLVLLLKVYTIIYHPDFANIILSKVVTRNRNTKK